MDVFWRDLCAFGLTVRLLDANDADLLICACLMKTSPGPSGSKPDDCWRTLEHLCERVKCNMSAAELLDTAILEAKLRALVIHCQKCGVVSSKQVQTFHASIQRAFSPCAEVPAQAARPPSVVIAVPRLSDLFSTALSGHLSRAWDNVRPYDDDVHRKESIVRELERVIRTTLIGGQRRPVDANGSNDLQVRVFGSSANGLGRATADVDCVVLAGPQLKAHLCPPGKPLAAFQALRRKLQYQGLRGWEPWQAIAHARIPLLRGVHIVTGVNVDLTFWQELPAHNTALLRTYASLHALIPPFIMAVKEWAKMRGVSAADKGTPSAYCWVLCCIFFLQRTGFIPSLQRRDVIEGLASKDNARQLAPASIESSLVSGWPVLYAHGPSVPLLLPSLPRYSWGMCGVGGEAEAIRGSMPQDAQRVNAAHLLAGFIQFWGDPSTRSLGSCSIRAGAWVSRAAFSLARPTGGDRNGKLEHDGTGAGAQPVLPHEQVDDGEYVPQSGAPAWRLSVEDPFELDHDIGRVIRPQGQARVEDELVRAAGVLHRFNTDPVPATASASAFSTLFRPIIREEVEAMEEEAGYRARVAAYTADKVVAVAAGGTGGGRGRGGGGRVQGGDAASPANIRKQAMGLTPTSAAALPVHHPARRLFELRQWLRLQAAPSPSEPVP